MIAGRSSAMRSTPLPTQFALFWRPRFPAARAPRLLHKARPAKGRKSFFPKKFARCFGSAWPGGIRIVASEPHHGISCCG